MSRLVTLTAGLMAVAADGTGPPRARAGETTPESTEETNLSAGARSSVSGSRDLPGGSGDVPATPPGVGERGLDPGPPPEAPPHGEVPANDVSPDGVLPPKTEEGAPEPEDPFIAELREWNEMQEAGEPDFIEDLDLFPDDVLDPDPQSGSEEPPLLLPGKFDSRLQNTELLLSGRGSTLNRQGFRFGLGTQLLYDSNLFLDDADEVADLAVIFSPTVEFRSAPPEVSGNLTFHYSPLMRFYLDDSSLNTTDHLGGATLEYTGPKGNLSASADYGRVSIADRFAGGRVETENLRVDVSGSYQVSARTSLVASWQGSTRKDEGDSESDSDTYIMQVAGLWRATSKLGVGPALRHAESDSGTLGSQETLAVLGQANFRPRDSFVLSAAAGVETIDGAGSAGDDTSFTGGADMTYEPDDRFTIQGAINYAAISANATPRFGESGGGGANLTGRLSCRYKPNERWTWFGGVDFTTNPSPNSEGTSVDDMTWQVVATRHLSRGSIGIRGVLSQTDYPEESPMAVPREDETLYLLALDFHRPVLAGRASLDSSLQFSQSSGGEEWERVQASVGLNMTF